MRNIHYRYSVGALKYETVDTSQLYIYNNLYKYCATKISFR